MAVDADLMGPLVELAITGSFSVATGRAIDEYFQSCLFTTISSVVHLD